MSRLAVRSSTLRNFLKPNRLKAVIFAVLIFLSLPLILSLLPLAIYVHAEKLQPLFMITFPSSLALQGVPFIIMDWVFNLFRSQKDFAIPVSQVEIENMIRFFLSLGYLYIFSCLLYPVIQEARQKPKSFSFLYLLLILFVLMMISSYLYTSLYLLTLPIFFVISVFSLIKLFKINRHIGTSLTIIFLLLVAGITAFSLDVFEDQYCYSRYQYQTSKTNPDGSTETVVSQEMTASGMPKILSNCYSDFKLFPALWEEVQKTL